MGRDSTKVPIAIPFIIISSYWSYRYDKTALSRRMNRAAYNNNNNTNNNNNYNNNNNKSTFS